MITNLKYKLEVVLLAWVVLTIVNISSTEAESEDLFDMNLEELANLQVQSVYATSKHDQLTTKAPSSVSIITEEEIRRYGWRNFGEILNSVRGFNVGFDRSFYSAGVRGILKADDFTDNGILVLVDGVRTNDAILGAASVSRDFVVDIDLIKRVEIVRGPGSVLYGSNAFYAVINVITRTPEDINGTELLASVGSEEEYRSRITTARTFDNGWSFSASANLFDRHGQSNIFFPEFDDPETNNGIAEDLDDDQVKNAFIEVSKDNLRIQAIYAKRQKDLPEAPFEIDFNQPSRQSTEKFILNSQYQYTFANDWDMQLKSSYNYFLEDDNYIFDNTDEGDGSFVVDSSEKFRGSYGALEAMVSKKLDDKHRVSLGTEYRRNFQQDIRANEDSIVFLAPGTETPELFELLSEDRSSNEVGVYTQAEFELNPKLFLTTGVRYDYYDLVDSNNSVNPRVALVYLPQENTSLKLKYDTAFRAPSGFEFLFNDGGFSQKSPESLDPEEISTFEAIVEHYFDENFRTTVTAYYTEVDDPISLEEDPSDGLLVFQNGEDGIEAYGFEFGLERKFDSGWKTRLSYAYQDNEDKATDQILANSPQNLFKANVIAPIIDDLLYVGLELQYTSPRRTIADNQVNDFILTNLTFSSDELFMKGLNLQLSTYNLLDQNIRNPGASYQTQDSILLEGRTFLAEAVYRF